MKIIVENGKVTAIAETEAEIRIFLDAKSSQTSKLSATTPKTKRPYNRKPLKCNYCDKYFIKKGVNLHIARAHVGKDWQVKSSIQSPENPWKRGTNLGKEYYQRAKTTKQPVANIDTASL